MTEHGQTTATHTEEVTTTDEVVVNGKLHVDTMWSFLVYLTAPFVKGGTALLITTGLIVFGAYELDRLGAPLLEKYGEYIAGQTEFTKAVKQGMESQIKSTEAIKDLVRQNGQRIDATAAEAIASSMEARIAAANANESAKQAAMATAAVAEKLHAAGQLMDEVSKKRDEQVRAQTSVLVELLDAVKAQSKNEQTSPPPTSGDVSKS